ncbi:MAG TPA: FCD domain-containing protein, partial [Gemmatimonadales bacterium]
RRVVGALDEIQSQSERLRRWGAGAGRAFSEHAVEDHRSIVEAIRQRDARLAEERMREHILRGLRQRLALLDM